MRLPATSIAAIVFLTLVAVPPSFAEDEPDVDCKNPMTQYDMNVCSDRDYKEADKALNAQWSALKPIVKEWDETLKSVGMVPTAEASLLKAQRAWIDYRDGQCDTEEASVQGGTMAPTIYSSCMAELTRKRTEELKSLAEGF
ncbi:lysozyme inhibitor LprI family protein [Rhizobium sp. CAU 1783]